MIDWFKKSPIQTKYWIFGLIAAVFITVAIILVIWFTDWASDRKNSIFWIYAGLFWFARFTFGHKLYWLTCGWDKEQNPNHPWKKYALHNWKRVERQENGATEPRDLVSAIKYYISSDCGVEFYLSICKRCDIKQVTINYVPNINYHQPNLSFEKLKPAQARFKWVQDTKEKYSTILNDIKKNAIDQHAQTYPEQIEDAKNIMLAVLPKEIANELIEYMNQKINDEDQIVGKIN